MELDDRVGWMLLGCLIGFGFGYIVRFLQEIRDRLNEVKEELDDVDEKVTEVDKIVKKNHPGDAGFMRHRYVADILMIIVLVIVAWSAFASQRASNQVTGTQDEFVIVSVCNQRFLAETIDALNQRTAYTQQQIQANTAVQNDQADLWRLLLEQPPKPEETRRMAAEEYLKSLEEFLAVSEKTSSTVQDNPFPDITDLRRCLDPEKYPSKKETP